MKYNLGCGNDYRFGWINVDRQPEVAPDVVWDLGSFPWPFADDSADEVAALHLLDEMPPSAALLPRFMQELYRICRNGATVMLTSTDPRHAKAALTPLGGGGITPAALQSYDLSVNEDWLARGLRHTPSSLYAKVDFTARSVTQTLDDAWLERWQSGTLGAEALAAAMLGQNNVVASSDIVLQAHKPFAPGRSLRQADALVLIRHAGLGDVMMALSACRGVKSLSDRPIYLLTSPAYRDFAALCPYVDHVFSDRDALMAHAAAAGRATLKVVDLSAARFGLSRLHEVDAFLEALALSPDDRDKGLVIDLPGASLVPALARELADLPAGAGRIVLHPGVSDPNRTLPAQFWRDLAGDCLARGHAVVLIGSSRAEDGRSVSRLGDARLLDFTDRLDLAGSLAVLRACDLLISADAGPIQLAGASDIGIIGVYTVVGGEKRLPYRAGSVRHRAVAIGPDCAFSPCYRWLTDPEVVTEFSRNTGLGGDNMQAFFGNWCVNADAHSCLREPTLADKVKAMIPAMLWHGAGPDLRHAPAESMSLAARA